MGLQSSEDSNRWVEESDFSVRVETRGEESAQRATKVRIECVREKQGAK